MDSSGCRADQSRYSIKVAVVTGQVRETVRRHNRHDHRVVRQESGRLADSGGDIHERCGECKDLDAHLRYYPQRRPEVDELSARRWELA